MNRRRRQKQNRMERAARVRLAGMISIAAVVAGVMVFTATSRSGELRTWKSATGTFSTEAELLETTADGAVRLKKKDGKEIKVPLDRLSAADQEYARAHMSDAAPAAKATAPPKSPDEVEEDAAACRTAKEAVLIYKFYLAQPNLTAEQREAAKAKLKTWEDMAQEDKVRLGKDWMTRAEADKIHKQADEKIEKAFEFLRLHNGELAKKTLEEASKLDPDSIQADFLMGVVYGAIAKNDRLAQVHFEKCLRREPDNVSVLNNLAITLVMQKKYPQAAQHWKTAASNAPKMKALRAKYRQFDHDGRHRPVQSTEQNTFGSQRSL